MRGAPRGLSLLGQAGAMAPMATVNGPSKILEEQRPQGSFNHQSQGRHNYNDGQQGLDGYQGSLISRALWQWHSSGKDRCAFNEGVA